MSNTTRMTPSEAFVETLVAHGVTTVFGIAGSAYMDAMDLFPLAGIRLVSVAHEQNAAHMADGYSHVTNRHGVCTAQNGPGVTNFVTAIAAAYWAHSPVVTITPGAGSTTAGLGGFQETDQMPIFSKITRYQVHVNSPARRAHRAGQGDACRRGGLDRHRQRVLDRQQLPRLRRAPELSRRHELGQLRLRVPGGDRREGGASEPTGHRLRR